MMIGRTSSIACACMPVSKRQRSATKPAVATASADAFDPGQVQSKHTRLCWPVAAKRTLDVVLSIAGLVVLSPIVVVATIMIMSTSSGPVIFRQTRVGRDGRSFQVLKFRTMVSNAEALRSGLSADSDEAGPLFKMRNDPRITAVGRWLRRLSIDEIPQFVNVLRGEMSLVGPRPALPDEMAAWPADLHRRLTVRPGITGLWQVSGRSDSSFEEYRRLDLDYVSNWTLLTDLKILARTPPAVLKAAGAY